MDEGNDRQDRWWCPWTLSAQKRCWQRFRTDHHFRAMAVVMALSMLIVTEWFWRTPITALFDVFMRAINGPPF